MAANKLDPQTGNNDIGLYFTRSRRVVVDAPFGELATWIKAGTAGVVVYRNSLTGEEGLWNLEAGETAPIACTKILASATIDGLSETTTAGNMFWATSGKVVGKAR